MRLIAGTTDTVKDINNRVRIQGEMIEMRQKKSSGKMHISELWNRDLFTMIKKSTRLREIKNFKQFSNLYNKEIEKMLEKIKERKTGNL